MHDHDRRRRLPRLSQAGEIEPGLHVDDRALMRAGDLDDTQLGEEATVGDVFGVDADDVGHTQPLAKRRKLALAGDHRVEDNVAE